MQNIREQIKRLLPLLAGAYLGFYFYGLVMTVFAPFEWILATVVAVICVLGLVAVVISGRLGVDTAAPDDRFARAARAQRERRGF